MRQLQVQCSDRMAKSVRCVDSVRGINSLDNSLLHNNRIYILKTNCDTKKND